MIDLGSIDSSFSSLKISDNISPNLFRIDWFMLHLPLLFAVYNLSQLTLTKPSDDAVLSVSSQTHMDKRHWLVEAKKSDPAEMT